MLDMKQILEMVAAGKLSPEDAAAQLQAAGQGYCDLGDAKVDLHRRHRRGFPEAVYCANKTTGQVLRIIEQLDNAQQNILCTRVSQDMASEILVQRFDVTYYADARILMKRNEPTAEPRGLILIISAGTSDIPVAEEAALSAEIMGNRVERVYDVGVAGIHRLFGAASEKMQHARAIIVCAGMEGALASVVAGLVAVPVIAVPTSVGYGAAFGGIAALLGMLNSCSGGISVVNIDNGFGAALVAHLINTMAEQGCVK